MASQSLPTGTAAADPLRQLYIDRCYPPYPGALLLQPLEVPGGPYEQECLGNAAIIASFLVGVLVGRTCRAHEY